MSSEENIILEPAPAHGLAPETMNLEQVVAGLLKFGKLFQRAHGLMNMLLHILESDVGVPIIRANDFEIDLNPVLREITDPDERKRMTRESVELWRRCGLRDLKRSLDMLQTFCNGLGNFLPPGEFPLGAATQTGRLHELSTMIDALRGLTADWPDDGDSMWLAEVSGLGSLGEVCKALGWSQADFDTASGRLQAYRNQRHLTEITPCLLKIRAVVANLRQMLGLS